MEIKISDGFGQLTQWDVGRTMQVSGVDGRYMVHFYSQRLSRALVVPPADDGTVAVPNILMQSSVPVVAAIFRQFEPDGPGYTTAIREFCVRAKAKPEDYEYEENIGYINWVDKAAEVDAFITELHRRMDAGEFDGFSPTVTILKQPDGHLVTITDRNGPHSFFVSDGSGPTIALDPTLTDPTKAAQAKATGDGIRKAQETADGKQAKIKPPGITPGKLIRAKTVVGGEITEWEAADLPSIPADVATTGYVDGKIREAIGTIDADLAALADRAGEVAL